MSDFLDPTLREQLSDIINSTPLFSSDETYSKNHYNLCCAALARLSDCVQYLNEHNAPPNTNNEIFLFSLYSCMVADSIKLLLKQFNTSSPYESANITDHYNPYQHFRTICLDKPLNIAEDNCPTDDKFFEYLRSLIFAHPFNTDRSKILEKDETQYSPYVMANWHVTGFSEIKDGFGIMVYSNKHSEMMPIILSFSVVKGYIQSRYQLLELVIEKIQSVISKQEEEWKTRKVKRSSDSIEVLNDMIEILEIRFQSSYEVKNIIQHLKQNSTNKANNTSIEKYRNAIIEDIGLLCDALDEGDIDFFFERISHFLYLYPLTNRDELFYCFEKVYGSTEIIFFTAMANTIANDFAKKWVTIDCEAISRDEITFLITVACYLENQEQRKRKQ